MTNATVTNFKPRDFAVSLMSEDVDDYGVPYERRVGVFWDAGVEPDWDNWLKYFCEAEGEKYTFYEIQEVTDREIEEF